MLTEREIVLYREAVYWYWKYDECAPDPGMGPTRSMLLHSLSMRTGISITKEEEEEILKEWPKY